MYNSDLPTRAELPSTRKLVISTAAAIGIAAVLLITVVLPAEFAIDPTGIGRALGLTQMGEIKNTLAQEAMTDAAAARTNAPLAPELPMQHVSQSTPAPGQRADEISLVLKSGEAAEVKLEMANGAKVDYEWMVSGGVVNFDTHGDNPKTDYHGYSTGEEVDSDSGELVAAFDGRHGWYWRNRGKGEVTVNLKTSGSYKSIRRVM
jgi:hypothetical protein